ncbi:MAG TPA: hypothetical protein VEC99_10610 [Clostridia bacterium]|nr:hypothetical protein [Clostridia bacterium]
MTSKVTVTVHELSSAPVKVGDVRLEPTQSRDFDLTKDLTISEDKADPEAPSTSLGGGDVWDHGNPNGITRAEISAKLPKAAGELEQKVQDDGRILETLIADGTGIATAAGGIEGAEKGQTPGPQPKDEGRTMAMGTNPTGAETGGASDEKGAPIQATKETVKASATSGPKASAKTATASKTSRKASK